MRDPHVVELRYRLVLSGDDEFRDPPPVERERDAFSMRLADDLLTVTMKEHHPTIDSARARVDPFVQSWEISAALQSRRRQVSFELSLPTLFTPRVRVLRNSYPAPPDAFVSSSDVRLMWIRYEQYLEGHEPLPAMAYHCLAIVERSIRSFGGNRRSASRHYGIDNRILNKLGELTANYGDENSARKADPKRPLTSRGEHWIREAVLVLIR